MVGILGSVYNNIIISAGACQPAGFHQWFKPRMLANCLDRLITVSESRALAVLWLRGVQSGKEFGDTYGEAGEE